MAKNLEENEKLKTEIKQHKLEVIEYREEIDKLNERNKLLSEVNGNLVRINDKQDKEITKLKDMIEEIKYGMELY